MTTTFTPGDAVGICGPSAHLIAGIKLDDPRLPRLWEVLSRGGDGAVDAVLEVLLEGGFATMPSFAVAATSGGATRVVVRHPAVVEAYVDGSAVACTSTAGGTWSDVTLEGASSVELRATEGAPASSVQLPFHAGMTPAAAVRVVLDDAAGPAPAPGAAAPAAAAPAPAPAPAADTSDEGSGTDPAASPKRSLRTAPDGVEAPASPEPATGPAAEEPADEEPVKEATPLTAIWKGHEAAAPEPEPEPEPASEPDPAAVDDSDSTSDADDEGDQAAEAATVDDTDDSDDVDGSTVLRPALGANGLPSAPPAPAASAPKPITPPPSTPAVAPPPAAPTPAASPATPPAAAPARSGLIDGVPWLTADWQAAQSSAQSSGEPAPRPTPTYETPSRPTPPPPPAPAAPAAPAAPPAPPAPAPPTAPPATTTPQDDDEADDAPTVLRAELVKELGSAGIVGPSVLAVDCPNGHQTSAHEPTCRLCKAPVGDSQEPRQIPRPPLGALVLASGDRLVLDKDAVLGRAPHDPEGSTERPHLLRVGDNGDISRQHARIMLDGWHVIVRDLGTANGTTLTLPGGSPQQLRANEDYQLEDGAEIGIADVVTLRYEVKP